MATAVQIREHYDSLALIYRTFWGDHIHHGLFTEGNESPQDAQIKLLEYCVALLKLSGHEKVLDIGCGHGGTLLHLANRLACDGTGISLSSKQTQIARDQALKAGLSKHLNFIVDNADSFGFPQATFDLAWVMESSEHFADKSSFFRRVVPALRPGGRLLLAAWTGSMRAPQVQAVAQAFLCPELWTAKQYGSAIESAGMEVRHCENLTAKVLRTWEICQERARAAGPAVKLLPRAAREFVEGIEIILHAYRAGDLTYTVLTAAK
jgi:cyclopropane fatty-acyl-phospholipid synthase-like methyltransferase